MGLATIDPHSLKEHTEIYKISKFGVNRPNSKQDTAIQKCQNLQRNVWLAGQLSGKLAIHFFVNFDILEWLYLAYYWVYLHQTWRFCKSRCALSDYVDQLVANPIIYRLLLSPPTYEIRQ